MLPTIMSRPPRLASANYVGIKQHFLTICTDGRLRVFHDPTVVDMVVMQILRAAGQHAFEISAYCFMPDHVHALVAGQREDSDLCRFVALAKQRSGFTFGKSVRRRLWQEGYFDRILRSDEPTFSVIRYIVENPLRAGIVSQVDDYPFWGSAVYTRQEMIDSLISGRP